MSDTKRHTCQPGEVRFWRTIMAQAEWSADAMGQVMDEVSDCPACLKSLLSVALNYCAEDVVLRAGGLKPAADLAAREIARAVMR